MAVDPEAYRGEDARCDTHQELARAYVREAELVAVVATSQEKVDDVLKSARQLDEWVGMRSIRNIAARAVDAATLARHLFNLRAALRRLQ